MQWTISIGLAGLGCASMVRADDFLLDLPLEPQRKTLWCWASVSTMAGHSANVRINSRRLKQLDIVKFARLDVRTNEQRIEKKTQIRNSICKLSNDECDEPGETWLYAMDGLAVPAGKVLSKSRIIHEIQERDRPVILKWDYQEADASDDLPAAEHYVIITGFNPDEDKFRVFDPWPVREGTERWISYEGYLQPGVDLGQTVFAMHEFDVYNLSAGAGSLEPGVAQGSNVLDAAPRRVNIDLQDVDFNTLTGSYDILRSRARHRVVYTPERRRITEPVREGVIFPIVVLRTAQLMRNRERPEMLLQPRAASLIATVVTPSNGKVVDSVLLYNNAGNWQEAEYSNTGIAARLAEVSRRFPRRGEAPQDQYYLVSIPEQAAFYAAVGFGEAARLRPLNERRESGFVSAHEALTRLAKRVDVLAQARNRARNNHETRGSGPP